MWPKDVFVPNRILILLESELNSFMATFEDTLMTKRFIFIFKQLISGITLLPVTYCSPQISFVAASIGFITCIISLASCSSEAVNIGGALGHFNNAKH